MSRQTRRKAANATRMATYFVKRLDAGVILDRTRPVDRNKRPTIAAPNALRPGRKNVA